MSGSSTPVAPGFPPGVLDGPGLRHPGRDYLLFSGPLIVATEIANSTSISTQSPNLFWPADCSWFVATEIDFDSTIVAGSSGLIADVLAEPPSRRGRSAWTTPSPTTGDTLNFWLALR